jgi:hypothetical protein
LVDLGEERAWITFDKENLDPPTQEMIHMAKSDSFFIRKSLNIDNDNGPEQTSIDLGAYVDALGKSVLRIHNIAVTFSDSTGRSNTVNSPAAAQYQLTTQSQTDIVLPSDKSVIASGRIHASTLDQRLPGRCRTDLLAWCSVHRLW